MQIAVLVEPVPGSGFRARSGEPFKLSSEGMTAEEALNGLRQMIAGLIQRGVMMVALDVPAQENPWKRLEGMLRDEPLYDEWQQAMAEYRQQDDR